jgi:hypothetical protein
VAVALNESLMTVGSFVSVVVPPRDRAVLLSEALRSLLTQDFATVLYEILSAELSNCCSACAGGGAFPTYRAAAVRRRGLCVAGLIAGPAFFRPAAYT